MAERSGEAAEKLVGQALKRVQLALAEVKVVQRYKDRKLLGETVVNHDAIVRARKKYLEAAHAIGTVRRMLGLANGNQRPNPKKVAAAIEELEKYRTELERLQGLS